jgi:hypothetical protein
MGSSEPLVSVKLFNGLRVREGDAFALSAAIREALLPLQRERWAAAVRMNFGDLSVTYQACVTAAGSPLRHPCDIGGDVVLISHGRYIYILTYGTFAHLAAEAIEASVLGVEEFAYWDNSDRPERLTAAQWASRKRIWSVVFDGWRKTSSEVGLTINLDSGKLALGFYLEAMEAAKLR